MPRFRFSRVATGERLAGDALGGGTPARNAFQTARGKVAPFPSTRRVKCGSSHGPRMNTHVPSMTEAPLCGPGIRPQLARPETVAAEDPDAGKQTRRRLITAAAPAPVGTCWEALHLLPSSHMSGGGLPPPPPLPPSPPRFPRRPSASSRTRPLRPPSPDACLPTPPPQYPGISRMKHCKIPKDSLS